MKVDLISHAVGLVLSGSDAWTPLHHTVYVQGLTQAQAHSGVAPCYQINTWSLWPYFLESYCYPVARKEGSWDHAAATVARIINLAWSKFLCISKVPWEREQPGFADRLSVEHLRDEISN